VLIELDEGEGKTDSGLYLPQGVKDKDRVQSGKNREDRPGVPCARPQPFGPGALGD